MKTLSGVVVDENGEPVIGATIMEQGTSNGAITNVNGEYTLTNVSNDATILVSYIGYKAMSFRAMDKDLAKVVLKEDSQALDEVVVTALGISRKEKNLSYATQSVSGGELQQVRDLNVVNSLSGKVAGLEISKVSSGLGGSSKISLRGNRSISGNNQALIVVDGVPIDLSLIHI